LLEGVESDGETLVTETVKNLRRNPLFFTIPEHSLVKLAEVFNVLALKKDEKFILSDDNNEFIVIVLRGEVKELDGNLVFKKEDFIARGMSISTKSSEIVATKNTTILYANRFSYFNLLLDEVEILNQMFDMIQNEKDMSK
jgi:signal-transduction protein with cAMP-binding, CBS, and nucleotidyltransferase domain